jgi:hypothetical protein
MWIARGDGCYPSEKIYPSGFLTKHLLPGYLSPFMCPGLVLPSSKICHSDSYTVQSVRTTVCLLSTCAFSCHHTGTRTDRSQDNNHVFFSTNFFVQLFRAFFHKADFKNFKTSSHRYSPSLCYCVWWRSLIWDNVSRESQTIGQKV